MAANITAQQAAQPLTNIDVKTKLLYGVLSTEKSFLIGVRVLVRREHVRMLVPKALSDTPTKQPLPNELIDMIRDHLADIEAERVRKMWKDTLQHRENVAKFRYVHLYTAAEHTVIDRLHGMGINTIGVRASVPRDAEGRETRGTTCFTHLSAAKRRPVVQMHLTNRSFSRPPQDAFWYSALKHGGLSIKSEPQHGDVQRFIDHVPGLQAGFQIGNFSNGQSVSGEVTSLSLCGGIEEAIESWNASAVEQFVKELDLDILPFDIRNPLRPGLSVWQYICDR